MTRADALLRCADTITSGTRLPRRTARCDVDCCPCTCCRSDSPTRSICPLIVGCAKRSSELARVTLPCFATIESRDHHRVRCGLGTRGDRGSSLALLVLVLVPAHGIRVRVCPWTRSCYSVSLPSISRSSYGYCRDSGSEPEWLHRAGRRGRTSATSLAARVLITGRPGLAKRRSKGDAGQSSERNSRIPAPMAPATLGIPAVALTSHRLPSPDRHGLRWMPTFLGVSAAP
jgi:hypothetical protein